MAEEAELSQFEQESLDAHNHYRKLHATPPLAYNKNMLADCQTWADVLAPRNEMEHSETKNGENIWYKWSSGEMEFTGKDSADAWYEEIKDYDYNNPGFASETGHFTQLLWKDTKEMAIAYSVSGQTAIAVAHYTPAGNITNEGYFTKNVLPLVAPPEEPAVVSVTTGRNQNGNLRVEDEG
ncbi:Golgi-associated plant pathogenesis-related protein 1-like [Amblyraja radiata]|uniref:Golgi-associated plant pathogenesis-related protein 1-like n=1 Tax=Amblyraja radiata TaxID=386614 RepID=UPI0014025D35|nr:Golgi-associated plant pathogenesis-related protein 1-like [Amblyraja radiata]